MSTTEPGRADVAATATRFEEQDASGMVRAPAVLDAGRLGPRGGARSRPKASGDARRLAGAFLLHLSLVAIAVPMILPFVWMVLSSLKAQPEIGTPDWLPARPQWHNYLDTFSFKAVEFGRWYVNSIFIAAWVTFAQVLTSAMAAFAFARLRWPARDKVFLLYLATMMLPGLVLVIPNYQIMIQLHLVDSYLGLILPAAFTAFGTFLLRQFMLTIPTSLDEAAQIDGANKWRVFWDVILPLARPGLVTLAIFTFIGNYQSFFWPLVMVKSSYLYTLPIGLLSFDSSQGQHMHLLMAAVTMSVLPLIVLFVVMQKQLVAGIQLGAVKG
jgi:multiple sugar transport system permease protein